MGKFCHIVVSKENASDDSLLLVKLHCKSGDCVEKNQIVATLESSKALVDLATQGSGVIYFNPACGEGTPLAVGTLLAVVGEFTQAPDSLFKAEVTVVQESSGRFSRKALEMVKAHNIDIEIFSRLSLVRERDVENYLAQSKHGELSARPMKSLSFGPKDIVVAGGGGHAKMCIDILRQQREYNLVGIIDAGLPVGSKVFDVEVLGSDSEEAISRMIGAGLRNVINGVGSVTKPIVRTRVFEKLKSAGLHVPALVHSSAVVEPSAVLAEGVQIMMGACVGSAVALGAHSIINSGAIVSHDCVIGQHCHVAPGAILAGGVRLDTGALIGMGVTIYIGVTIGENAIIANGQHIFNDVREPVRKKL